MSAAVAPPVFYHEFFNGLDSSTIRTYLKRVRNKLPNESLNEHMDVGEFAHKYTMYTYMTRNEKKRQRARVAQKKKREKRSKN